jgi:peptide/nickel transport system substrate-binding protein
MRHSSSLTLPALVLALWPAAAVQAQDIVVGFTADALTLDPANHRHRDTETIIRNMSDGLLTRDPNMQVVPELAESFSQFSPVLYEFKLRQGVKFHSGDEMTAEDVAFTFNRIVQEGAMGGETSPRKGLLGPVESVEVIDAETVHFHLASPWPLLPAMLPFQEMVQQAFTEAQGNDGMASNVNGTGPFRLAEWRKADSIIMERFDDYYGGSPHIPPVGPAKSDRVIFRIIPESASRVAALLAGEVHIINELPAHSMAQVANNAGTEVMTVNGTRTFFIALDNVEGPFTDVKVRQAANHALDKALIIDRILNGTATPLNGVMSPDAFAFNADLPEYEYNVDRAKELLTEAGYPDGLDVTLDVEAAFRDIGEAIASVLTQAGIRTRIEVGETELLIARWRGENPTRGDMWLTSWGNGSLDPFDIMEPTLVTGARGNSAGYSNPEVDALIASGDVEMDPEARAGIYQEAQAIVNAEAPWVFLWLPQDIYGVSSRLKGWQPSADSRINLHRAYLE